MRRKRPHVASLDEVKITRNDDEVIIEYVDEKVWTTHFRLGPEVQSMTAHEILDQWNECVRAQEQAAAHRGRGFSRQAPDRVLREGLPMDAPGRPAPLCDR